MKRIFYFAFESIFDPVIDSQVISFLKELKNKTNAENLSANLVIFNSINDFFKKDYIKKKKEIQNLLDDKVYFFIKFPYLYRFPKLFRSAIFLNTVICFFFLIAVLRLKKNEKVIFHCRTDIASFILLKIREALYKKAKVICDCRGIGSKEILYKYPGGKGYKLSKSINKIETYAQAKSDYIFCVSSTFRDYISKNIIDENPSFKVIPCCIDIEKFRFIHLERQKKRQELGLKDKFVVIYSGSLNEWQLPGEMIKIFLNIKKIIKNSIFVIFTGDKELAEKLLLKSGLEDDFYIVRKIPFKDMGEYLQVGDLGFLIREDNDVNRVASPIKFPEYIRCGVPVVSSMKSDVKEYIEKYNMGYFIDDYKNQENVENVIKIIKSESGIIMGDEYKKRISRIIGENMSWSNFIYSIIKIYEKI